MSIGNYGTGVTVQPAEKTATMALADATWSTREPGDLKWLAWSLSEATTTDDYDSRRDPDYRVPGAHVWVESPHVALQISGTVLLSAADAEELADEATEAADELGALIDDQVR